MTISTSKVGPERWADWDKLSQLCRLCFPDDEIYVPPAKSLLTVAIDEAGLAGFAVAEPAGRGKNRHYFIARTGVHPRARGNGLNTRLILSLLGEIGDRPVKTYVLSNNPASLNSMIAAGFRVCNPPRTGKHVGEVWLSRR